MAFGGICLDPRSFNPNDGIPLVDLPVPLHRYDVDRDGKILAFEELKALGQAVAETIKDPTSVAPEPRDTLLSLQTLVPQIRQDGPGRYTLMLYGTTLPIENPTGRTIPEIELDQLIRGALLFQPTLWMDLVDSVQPQIYLTPLQDLQRFAKQEYPLGAKILEDKSHPSFLLRFYDSELRQGNSVIGLTSELGQQSLILRSMRQFGCDQDVVTENALFHIFVHQMSHLVDGALGQAIGSGRSLSFQERALTQFLFREAEEREQLCSGEKNSSEFFPESLTRFLLCGRQFLPGAATPHAAAGDSMTTYEPQGPNADLWPIFSNAMELFLSSARLDPSPLLGE